MRCLALPLHSVSFWASFVGTAFLLAFCIHLVARYVKPFCKLAIIIVMKISFIA
nr:MAG TPA: hypothetical protein [Caudoviricetes sp.]